MKFKINKLSSSLHLSRIMYFTLCFVLFSSLVSYSQESPSGGILKSKNVTTIAGAKFYLHTVEKGQTLFAIAKCYELSLNDIVIENPEAINGIKPGQVLKVPVKKAKKIEVATVPEGANYILHVVESGQTLYSISRQYDTSVDKIKDLNSDLSDGLKIGQTLKIPSLKTKTAPKGTVKNTKTSVNPSTAPVTTFKMGPIDSLTSFMMDVKNRPRDSVTISKIIYPGEIKDQYNIAFFLPFHLDVVNEINTEEVVKEDEQLSNKTIISLQFYEGALLAIDSLKKQQLNAKIFVYDIDDKDSLNIVNILKKPELKKMDLMIGPFYGSSFMPVSKFAKEHSIPIVSPFIQINKILFNNPYVCKVLPSSILQVEQMAHFVVDTFHKQNIILVNSGNMKEISFYNAFKNTANKALKEAGYKVNDSLKEVKSLGAIEGMLTPSKINVIVLPSNNQSYVTEFISKLNTLRDKNKIVLMGLQSWVNYDNLDFEYLNNLTVHIPSNNYIDYQNPSSQNFIKAYRERFKTEPELYSYDGFDISYFFISALQKEGSGFLNKIVGNNYQGIESNFNFMQYPLDSGFENKFVYILKYQDNKLVKAN